MDHGSWIGFGYGKMVSYCNTTIIIEYYKKKLWFRVKQFKIQASFCALKYYKVIN